MLAKGAPDGTCVRRPVAEPELVKTYAMSMEQARHVVVRRHEQRSRIGERVVLQEDLRVDVSVRGHDRQVRNGRIDLPSDRTHRRVGWQQPVRVEV